MMSTSASITFTGTVIAVIAAAGVAGLFSWLIDKDTRQYYKSLLEEWRRKGGGR